MEINLNFWWNNILISFIDKLILTYATSNQKELILYYHKCFTAIFDNLYFLNKTYNDLRNILLKEHIDDVLITVIQNL